MVYDPKRGCDRSDDLWDAQTQEDLEKLRGQDLTFSQLRSVNNLRYNAMPDDGTEQNWTLPEWTNALAGEAGELCNLAKKTRRGLPTDPTVDEARVEMGYELADIVIYADIVAQQLGIDLGAFVREKFNIVSERRGSDIRL